MRGKLRDKRASAKRDGSRREEVERRRLGKRDNRSVVRLNWQTEDDDLEFDIEEGEYEEEEEEEIETPRTK